MTTRTLDRCAIAWLACGLAASGAAALQPTTRASSFDRTFTVSPAPAEDRAPLQERPAVFAFSQEALELRHENAATLYLMAIPQLPGRGDEEWGKRFEEFGDKPIHELDPVQARQVLHHPQGAAAGRAACRA